MNGKMIYYRGLEVYGEIITGDWEGDPSVPGGVNRLPAYAQNLEVRSPDGDDVTDMLTDEAIEECEAALMEDV
jgi:hypothetical protein